MFHYRVTIAYKGTHFRGWQAQSKVPQENAAPTIQGTIHQALRKIARYQDCAITACSRTDAGVHARGQIGKISVPRHIPADTLLLGLNSVLPGDIRMLTCNPCSQEFNPQSGSTSKEYHYYFSCDAVASPVLSELVAHVPGSLDIAGMRQGAQVFIGEHDFTNFYRRSSLATTTIRTIFECDVRSCSFVPMAGELYYLRIVGSGFLKQMIRYMAGALFDVARGRVSLGQLEEHLHSFREEKLSAKAKAKGLHLVAIEGLSL